MQLGLHSAHRKLHADAIFRFDGHQQARYFPRPMHREWQINPSSLVAALIFLGILGRLIELVLPVFVAAAGRDLSFSNDTLGIIAGAELIGTVVFSLFCAKSLSLLGARTLACIGVVCLTLGNFLTGLAHGAGSLIGLRFLAGLLGEGPLLVVAVTLLGQQKNASRVYALFMGSQMIIGGLALALLGWIDSFAGFRGVTFSMTALTIAGLAAALLTPSQKSTAKAEPPLDRMFQTDVATLVLIGMASFHISVAAAWTFMQQKGAFIGLDEAASGALLAIMLSGGLFGAAYVALLKTGRVWVLISCATLALSATAALLTNSPVVYAIAGTCLMISWNIAVPHQIAQLGEDIGAKRRLALVPGAQGLGLAAGPVLAGHISAPGQYIGVACLVALSLAVAYFCFWMGYKRVRGD